MKYDDLENDEGWLRRTPFITLKRPTRRSTDITHFPHSSGESLFVTQ